MANHYRSNFARILCCCLVVLCAASPVFASSQCATFQGPTAFASGAANQDFSAIADLNGDGKPDLVVVNNAGSAGNNVFVFLGNGDGTFSAGPQLNAGGTGAIAVAVGDFNGDGKPDLAVINNNTQVVVFLNTSTGGTLSFGSAMTNSIDNPSLGGAGTIHGFITIGDVDGDGKLDIAVIAAGKAEILLGNGDGTFQSVFKTAAISSLVASGFALVDINGDGKPDLVFASSFNGGSFNNTNQLQIALNNSTPGSLSFGAFTTFSMGPASPLVFLNGFAVADINGDGKPDIVIGSSSTGGGLFVFLNTTATGASTPTFSGPTNIATFLEDTIAAVDINGDGKPDIIGLNSGSTSGATLINTTTTGGGTPTFTAGTTFTSTIGNASFPFFMSIEDLNGDGQPDLVVLDKSPSSLPATVNQNVIVLLGLGGNTNTMIAAPSAANFGAPVTLTATLKAGTLQAATTPTGSVQFTDNNVNVGSPATLSGSAGTATAFITDSTLALGSHPLRAVYTGDANFCPSTSVVFNETISSQHSSTTTLSTSANPSDAGQSVTFTATVISSGGPTPTGTVTFKDGASTLGTGNLNGSGMATLSTSSLTAGAHSITASYPGDANTLASNSSTLTQNVQDFTLGANTQTLTVKAGQSGMVTITLTPEGGFNSTVQLSCGTLPAESTCSFNPASLTPNGAAVASTLTFNTTAASALLTPATPWKGRGSLYAWLSFPTISLAGLVWAVGAKRSRKSLKQMMLRTWLHLLLLLLALVMVLGCGGGNGGGGGNPGTPPGTSAVSVAVSGAGLSHSLTLTITVTQ